jgi:ABC-type lipoprotein release transport system permease subunit
MQTENEFKYLKFTSLEKTVSGLFSAGIDEIDGQVIYMPLAVTQEILRQKDQIVLASPWFYLCYIFSMYVVDWQIRF